jgi:sialic acid synthase SpsE
MFGTDQSCSVTPWGLFKLVSGIRELEVSYGDGELKVTDSEKEVLTKLRK